MISIIIPTRNRACLLGSAILSLVSQCRVFDDSELIIVDNGSTDNTESICKRLESLFPNFVYVYEDRPGLHSGRHRGISVARGSILVFLDDDIEVADGWLSAIYDNFRSADLAMLGGNNVPVFFGTPPLWLDRLWRVRDNVRSLPSLSIQEHPIGNHPISPYLIWGCNFVIRKDVLLAAGGFHPDGMPHDLIRFRGDGETHISKYVADNNLKCMFDSRASVYHKVTPERMSLEYFRKRGFNQGVSDSYSRLRNPPKASVCIETSGYRKLMLFLKSNLRATKRKAREIVNLLPPPSNPAQLAYNDGYISGFAYHQASYKSDPEVRAWVHKENYL